MVFIKQINPNTFMVLATLGESFCLRDFSGAGRTDAIEIARQSPGRTATNIREMAREEGNHLIDVEADGHSVERDEDYEYWHRRTVEFNEHFLPLAVAPQPLSTASGSTPIWVQILVGVAIAVLGTVILYVLGLKP
jgi:hypothetical protein